MRIFGPNEVQMAASLLHPRPEQIRQERTPSSDPGRLVGLERRQFRFDSMRVGRLHSGIEA